VTGPTLLLFSAFVLGQAKVDPPAQAARKPVVELFEDDAEGLLKLLTNPGDGPGQGDAESEIVFSGKRSIKISSYQRFQRNLPGWDYAIREKPEPGQYRYLRLAWKSGGVNCMMLQLHDATDWHLRYTAGANPYGWQTRFVAKDAPATWTIVTIDVFKDFGERTLKGIAFTISGGAGYFDHVYLGRTIEDLDRIDATGLSGKQIPLETKELGRLWQELADKDASKQYRAFWTLVAGRAKSTAYLKEKMVPAKLNDAEAKQVRVWISQLNSDVFAVRERAVRELKLRVETIASLLEMERARTTSAESQRRLDAILGELVGRDQDVIRREKARRILTMIDEQKR
jgi:hypothetical protein